MKNSTRARSTRKAKPCLPDLFSWSRDVEHLTSPAVRSIMRRTGYSPSVALVIAELAGLVREGRHG